MTGQSTLIRRRGTAGGDYIASRSTASSDAREGYAKAVGDRGFEDADDGHFAAARPPRPGRDERLRRAHDEVGDGADHKGCDHRGHADGEEERDDRDETADGRRDACRQRRAPRIRERLLAEAKLLLDERAQELLRFLLQAFGQGTRLLGG